MNARKIEGDTPEIADARARLFDEACASLPLGAVYRHTPATNDTPRTLEERLRAYRPYRIGEGEWFGPKVCAEAADEIASLRARVEVLSEYLGIAIEDFDNQFGRCSNEAHWTNEARQALKDTPVE